MPGRLARFLLPVALLAAAAYLLFRSAGEPTFLTYFMSAVLVGMAIAALQRARKDPDEH